MKKILFSFLALTALIVALVSWKKMYDGGGAVHASGDDCYFVVNQNTSSPLDPSRDDLMHLVKGTYNYTETPSGNAVLVCKGTLDIPAPKSAYHLSTEDWFAPCYKEGVTNGGTFDWEVTVTPSGQAIAVCHW